MTRAFVAAVEKMAKEQAIPVIQFEKGQHKETIAEPFQAELLSKGA